MISPDYSGIWRNGHSTTYDVINLHVSRCLWRATYRLWIDLSTGVSILNIDCIPTELIEKKKTWSVFGVKLVLTLANIPLLDHGLLSRVFHWLRSKHFRPVEGVHRIKDRGKKKAEKNEKERSKEKIGTVQQNKKNSFPNFGLCACAKGKSCTFLHGNAIKNLMQCQKVHSSKV